MAVEQPLQTQDFWKAALCDVFDTLPSDLLELSREDFVQELRLSTFGARKLVETRARFLAQ